MPPGAGESHPSRGPCHPAGICRQGSGLHRGSRYCLAATGGRSGPDRRGRRLLRDHRFSADRGRPSVRRGRRVGSAGQASCRAAFRPERCRPRRPPPRFVCRSPRIPLPRRHRCDGCRRDRRGHSARRLLYPARTPIAADCGAACRWRADRRRHRLQPRFVADDLAVPCDEHGLHPVPIDPARGATGHHDPCRPRLGA